MFLAMLAAATPLSIPPCKDGRENCKPWERAWPAMPGYDVGPFNLILHWGNGTPVIVRYENRARCEMAALEVDIQGGLLGKAIRSDGTVIEPKYL
jgi:hypothetical protein